MTSLQLLVHDTVIVVGVLATNLDGSIDRWCELDRPVLRVAVNDNRIGTLNFESSGIRRSIARRFVSKRCQGQSIKISALVGVASVYAR